MNESTKGKSIRQPLSEEDYYFNEQGLMVFTAAFHRKRGHCCKSGCKHCPYGYHKREPKS